MSLPHSQYDPRRVCIIPFPTLPFLKHKRALGVYAAGVLVRNLERTNQLPLIDYDYSLRLPTGFSWMLAFYHRMLALPRTRHTILCLYTLHFSVSFNLGVTRSNH
jgi:hypothetical protein